MPLNQPPCKMKFTDILIVRAKNIVLIFITHAVFNINTFKYYSKIQSVKKFCTYFFSATV